MVNLTALATSAMVVNILDFQGRALDLTAGSAGDYVPVQAFEFVNNLNQQVSSSQAFKYSVTITANPE